MNPYQIACKTERGRDIKPKTEAKADTDTDRQTNKQTEADRN